MRIPPYICELNWWHLYWFSITRDSPPVIPRN